jgi:hypothetical protein
MGDFIDQKSTESLDYVLDYSMVLIKPKRELHKRKEKRGPDLSQNGRTKIDLLNFHRPKIFSS